MNRVILTILLSNILTMFSSLALAQDDEVTKDFVVEYQNRYCQVLSTYAEDQPTLTIRPFDEEKFSDCKGVMKSLVNGETVLLDYNQVDSVSFAYAILYVPYEVNDTASYGKIHERRIDYINRQLTLISEIEELIPKYSLLEGKEPVGDLQKILFATLISRGEQSADEKIQSISSKAKEKNKFNKKFEVLNDQLLADLQKKAVFYKSLLEFRNKWEDFFNVNVKNNILVYNDGIDQNDMVTKAITELKKKTLIACVNNPFLLDPIEIPNPFYDESAKATVVEAFDGYFQFENTDYNFKMLVPECFIEEYRIFGGNGNYIFLYGREEHEGYLFNAALEKKSAYLFLDGDGIYSNDMSNGVYKYLSKQDGETNKKTIGKSIFSSGYAISCSLTYGGKPFLSRFYALNLRNGVQLRFYLRYPASKKGEFEDHFKKMIDSIEAY